MILAALPNQRPQPHQAGPRSAGIARSVMLALAVLFGAHMAAADPTPLLPAGHFAAYASFDQPSLSPDGTMVAYLSYMDDKAVLVTQPLAGGKASAIPPLDESEIWSFHWANDETLLIELGLTRWRGAFRKRVGETKIISYNLTTGKFLWLAEPDQKKRLAINKRLQRDAQMTSQIERIVNLIPGDPDHILMELDFELDGAPSVYKVDVKDGSRARVMQSRSIIQHWYADQNADIRLGLGYDSERKRVLLKDGTGNWVNLDKVAWTDRFSFEGFAGQSNLIYVSGLTEQGTRGIFLLDLTSGEVTETVFAEPEVDAENIVLHPVTGRIAGIEYQDRQKSILYIDPDLARVQAGLEAALPGTKIEIVDRLKDRNFYLVLAQTDRNMGEYYLMDDDRHEIEVLARRMPQLPQDQMAPTHELRVPMRDGIQISAFLTVPRSYAKGTKLPLVVMPHGGPIGVRDDASFDWWAQFLANRGYAVLKPNFRGSGGAGAAFQAAGENQWGGLMQDDVTDATRWLIDQGLVDADRVCIVGASYGGYAALMGAVREPGLYKCAISVNGVTDIPDMKSYDKDFVGGDVWTRTMGLEGSPDKQVSPTYRADEINIPVLMLAAKDDIVVPARQSKDMDKKLRKANKASHYVELDYGGHWLQTAQARLTVLEETEKFLEQYLK